ncbi:Pyrroline-5-carboxylate reductase [uncultured virus]|nr:Pyrroline-5-carboxylate reductase [uncultured virus]
MPRLFNSVGVIGTGNLGESLIKMILRKSRIPSVICSVRTEDRKTNLINRIGPNITKSESSINFEFQNPIIAQKSECLILSVKPGQIKEICNEIKDFVPATTPVISAAAAISLTNLHNWLPTTKGIIRIMPGITCAIGQGIIPYTTRGDLQDIYPMMMDIFAPNTLLPLKTDAEIDAATLIAGCGPAFFAWFSTQLRNSVARNLSDPDIAKMLAITMRGTGSLMETMRESDIITSVASKKGATEAVLKALENNTVDREISIALNTAQRRIEAMAGIIH